jgi:hypothetical protein
MSGAADMSGLWSGVYFYGGDDGVSFTAWIEDMSGVLSGTTLEPNTFAPSALEELEAHINGSREGADVEFKKLYAPSTGIKQPAIVYRGKADTAFTTVVGTWTPAGSVLAGGSFRMMRLKTAKSAAEEKSVLLPLGA